LGTLILTLSIVVIEVALIAAVMLTADAAPTLKRDTMFAV
jgi:Ca2+:H+ antiporter